MATVVQLTGLDAPAFDFFPVTPNDSTDLASPARGLSWAVDGDVVIITPSGTTRTLASGSLATKVIHSIRAVRILSTGTTATGIVAYI